MQPGRAADLAGRRARRFVSTVCLVLCLLPYSCRRPGGPLYYHNPAHPADYLDRATKITYPDLDKIPDADVNFSIQPRTVRNLEKEEIWDLSLAECIQIALSNSSIIRNQAQFLSPQNPVMVSPDNVSTVFDPAIQESGVLYGQRGVEAALSDFDTQFTTQMLWGHNETIQANTISSGLQAGNVLNQDTGVFSSSLQKRTASGASIAVTHNMNYTANNVGRPPQLFPSYYDGNIQLQFRQPLLAGGGVEYNRIAGPVSTNIQGVTGVQQGVIIARINDDIALADFERSVHQMMHDLETLYWQLYQAYRSYDIQVQARDVALETWRKVNFQILGSTGPGGAQEAELRDNYLTFKGQAEVARDAIYAGEAQLRLLMGLPVNDGRVIRPIDSPVSAEFVPDWSISLADAFSHRPEIRRQKWNIRSLDLQRRAAENLTMPRLDFVSAYQVNGFGDDLFDIGNGTATGQFPSAYGTLFQGQQTGWNLGFEFSMPLGRRFAHAQVRSLELKLAKAQAMLGEQEVEITHEIAAVFRDIDRNYVSMQNAYQRWQAARDRIKLAEAQYRNDPTQYSIETVTRAQQSLTQSEMTFVTSLVQYNTSLADLYYRTGRTLQVNNIHLSEGPWCQDATINANERYKARQYAVPSTLRIVEPEILSAPWNEPSAGQSPLMPAPPAEETEPTPIPEKPLIIQLDPTTTGTTAGEE